MGYSNGKITGIVSINDVQKALGVSLDNVGALCKSAKINMWARCKPVWFYNSNSGTTLFKQPGTFTNPGVETAVYYGSSGNNASVMPDGNTNHYNGDHGVH